MSEIVESEGIDLESIPDKINTPQLVKEVMQVLEQSDSAAYTVYLKLRMKYAS